MSIDEVDVLLNKDSGLKGLCGDNDMREIHKRGSPVTAPPPTRSRSTSTGCGTTFGAYLVALGGADAIVFTAGVGQHDAITRARTCADMGWLGLVLDPAANIAARGGDIAVISAPDSPSRCWWCPRTRSPRSRARPSACCRADGDLDGRPGRVRLSRRLVGRSGTATSLGCSCP